MKSVPRDRRDDGCGQPALLMLTIFAGAVYAATALVRRAVAR